MKKPGVAILATLVLGLLLLIELRPWQHLSQIGSAKLSNPANEPSSLQAVRPAQAESRLSTKNASAGTFANSDSDSAGPVQSGTLIALGSQPIRAQLSPVTYTTIAAELSARVQEISRREGDLFAQGDTLVVFDCGPQRAQLQKSQAALAITQRNYETNKKLAALGSVGELELDNSRSEYEKSKAEVEELIAIIGRCKIVAPFPGKVVEQRVRSQQFVQAGQAMLEILDNRALELEFIAPSRWAAWIHPGYSFRIKIDETGKSYPARVTRVGARIDSVSQTVKVAAVIDGEFAELSPGMSGTLIIKEPSGAGR